MWRERELADSFARRLGRPLELRVARRPLHPGQLAPPERERWRRFACAERRREFLIGRAALRRLTLTGPRSLTHADGFAIAAAAAQTSIGIDLETEPRGLSRALRLYLHEQEIEACRHEDDALRLWTVKEAVFKAARTSSDWFGATRLQDARGRAGVARFGTQVFCYASLRFRRGWLSVAITAEGEVA